MREEILSNAIEKLSREFDAIEWKYLDVPPGSPREKTQLWPGLPSEDIMVCVYKGKKILELFHRQDFFFFNFAYQGDYNALSYQFDKEITVHEGECYIGQPHAGYAIQDQSKEETIIIGVLIQTRAFFSAEAYFKSYFHVLAADSRLFQFFLNPKVDQYSDEYILLRFDDQFSIRRLLEVMVVEYAEPTENSQAVLQSLTMALMMQVARQYKHSNPPGLSEKTQSLAEQIVSYIGEHIDTVTLQEVAKHFSYHPNYISTLLPKETGKTFSAILLEQRMVRAVALLEGTTLPVSEIAALLGYSNSSNFYKAFRAYYGVSPREYQNRSPDQSP
ncbi:MAG: helix-turn-helix transcriptional regulator [Clostridiales bacterium]|nr:helix-turn-helix transcriptional regulator [Clostridiales bacterium]